MLLFLAVAKTTRARKSHAHRLPDFLHHTPLQVPRAVATSCVAACGGRERGGGEDTSRSGRGLAAPCTPAFSLAISTLQRSWNKSRAVCCSCCYHCTRRAQP